MVFPSLINHCPSEASKDKTNILVYHFVEPFGTFNEATLVGNNTFGYLVTVILRETLTSDKEKLQ